MEIDLFSLLPQSSVQANVGKSENKGKNTPSANADIPLKEGNGLFNLVLSGLKETNKLENNADKLTQDLVSGKLENIHDLMIASEKAEIALNFTMAIRNQALRAYQEIMGMGR
ncbi:MAG: flagellar hook-basal body complex protein FliE [bacterium]